MDTQRIRQLADSAQERAQKCYRDYQARKAEGGIFASQLASKSLNDYFYWIGHANAYKGIVSMVELATIVEDELDAEATCP